MEYKINQFTEFALSDDEIISGSLLSSEQKALLQNDLADLAMRRANIKHDLNNPGPSLLEDAALVGQINFIQYLFTRNDSAFESQLAVQETQQ